MKKIFLLLPSNFNFLFFTFLLVTLSVLKGNAQSVGIGTTSPNASAQLDVQSTTKGFLPPRMTAAQRKAILSPANGLIVFDTDVSQLYVFDGSAWQPLISGSAGNNLYPSQTLQPAGDRTFKGYFGIDVAMWANYAVAGAPNADSGSKQGTGTVHVFKKNTSGAWLQVAKLYASDPQTNSYFGSSVAISGNYIVVGASEYDNGASATGSGKVYVFVKGTGDTWTQQTAFTQAGVTGTSYEFGYYLAVSTTSLYGPAIVVGAPYTSNIGSNRGAAYIYRFANNAWSLQQTLIPNDLSNDNYFGNDVDIDGDYCVIGAPYQNNVPNNIPNAGAVYIYVFGGGVWSQQDKILGFNTGASFGSTLSLQNNIVAVGAPRMSYVSGSTAAVYVFMRNLTTWGQFATLYFSEQSGFGDGSFFGQSLSLDSNNLMIGIPAGIKFHSLGSLGGNGNAAVAVYKKYSDGSGFYLNKLLHDNDALPSETGGHFFGHAVSTKNGNYIIGIPTKRAGDVFDAGAIAFGFVE